MTEAALEAIASTKIILARSPTATIEEQYAVPVLTGGNGAYKVPLILSSGSRTVTFTCIWLTATALHTLITAFVSVVPYVTGTWISATSIVRLPTFE